MPRILVASTIVVCALLATGTFLRNREYRSRLSIAETIVERWPSGRGYFLFGSELVAAGRNDEAMAQLRASARDYPGAHYALGTELLAAGMFDAAIVELETFLRLLPAHPNAIPARDMLGRAYLSSGRIDDAVREFELVLTDPNYPFRAEVRGFVDQIRAARRAGPAPARR
jgi:tetratricopeptide (TPR) repeat protein